ncbi:MAG: molybdopterin-dependent oxidoreductase [Gammaproteobacteria bacterium]|nr:molybdopterin-dependent oxidoreductase [Gammaproteobacteria bacterium]
MSAQLSRREFLKAGAGLAALGLIPPATARSIQAPGQPDRHAGLPVQAIPSLCEMCFWRCGILGKRSSGQLLGIEGNPDHPLNRGRLCARGLAGSRLLYDPDRLKYPLIRVGERGEGRWRRASWDEALGRVTEGLEQTLDRYGPNGIAYFTHGASSRYFKALMRRLGAWRFASASFGQCRGPRDTGYGLTFGSGPGSPERLDFENADAILLIGSHLGENVHTSQISEFTDALVRGARLIVVDPRYSVAASKAELWLPLRPGTDIALLQALMRYLLDNQLYDRDYVTQYCTGAAQLRDAVAHATLEWAAAVTDLPAGRIESAARLLSEARPRALIHPGRFSAWYGNDTQRSRALAILTALLGAWGREGGIFPPGSIRIGGLCCSRKAKKHASAPPQRPPFIREGYPSQDLVRDSLGEGKHPVRLWFIYGANLLHSMPEPARTIESLKRQDFVFMVDVLPTETALYADVILPEATYLERYDAPLAVTNAKRPFIALRQPVIQPLYETRDPYWIARELAQLLGVTDCLECVDMEEAIDRQLQVAGSSLAEVARTGILDGGEPPRYPPLRFPTPSGKAELYSQRLDDAGLDPVPRYRPLPQAPAGFMRVTNGRSPYHSFTRSMNNAWLAEMAPVNALWLNDRVASAMGLADGQEVKLENQDGVRSGPVPLKVTPGIRPELVFLPHGWGQHAPALSIANGRGASDNQLMTRFAEDPETGATGLRVNFVRLVANGRVLDAPTSVALGIAPEPQGEPMPHAYAKDDNLEAEAEPPGRKPAEEEEWSEWIEEGC